MARRDSGRSEAGRDAAAQRGKNLVAGRCATDLERALVANVRAVRARDPLGPIDIVVGSNLLGISLSRLLATRLGAIAGVRTQTILDLARRRVGREFEAAGRRLLSPIGREILARAIVESERSPGPFKAIAGARGLAPALLETFDDLEEAGWTPDALRAASAEAFQGRTLTRARLEQLADLFAGYRGARDDKGLYDRNALLVEGARRARGSGVMSATAREDGDRTGSAGKDALAFDPGPLFVYGFYDFNEVQWRLLLAEASHRETTFFVPLAEPEDSKPSLALLERLTAEGFERIAPDGERAIPHTSASAGEENRASNDGPELTLLAAPDEGREAEEIARTILEWAASGIPFSEMAILTRGNEVTRDNIARVLARAGIPYLRAHGRAIVEDKRPRAALALLSVRASGWGREEVIELLSLGASSGPTQPMDAHESASAWDLVSAEAGIVSGERTWEHALVRQIEAADREIARLDEKDRDRRAFSGDGESDGDGDGDERSPTSRRARARLRRESATALLTRVRRLGSGMRRWPSTGTWEEVTRGFLEALEYVMGSHDQEVGDDACAAALETVAALDAVGTPANPEAFAAAARRAIEEGSVRGGRLGRDGVLLADAGEVRGVAFRAVAIAGLADRVFPPKPREDPILSDAERAMLDTAIESIEAIETGPGISGPEATPTGAAMNPPPDPRPGPLPLKSARIAEERLLFALTVASARAQLLLTWPRRLDGADDPRSPSPLVKAFAALAGITHLPPDRPGSDSRYRFVSRLEGEEGGPATLVDPHEWHLDSLRGRKRGGRGLRGAEGELARGAEGELARQFPFLARGFAAAAARGRTGRFTGFDGALTGSEAEEAAQRVVGDRGDARGGAHASASRIERYAVCPLQSLFADVLRLEETPDPVAVLEIDARDRGSAIHAILKEFLAGLAAETNGPVDLLALPLPELRRRLREIAERALGRLRYSAFVGAAELWEIEQQRILDQLERWLEGEVEKASESPMRPALFEWSFGRDGDDAPPLAIALPQGGEIAIAGRIDRIDIDPATGHAKVIDYKSGKSTDDSLAKRARDGRMVQLPLYAVAATAACAAGAARASASSTHDVAAPGPPLTVVSATYRYLANTTDKDLEEPKLGEAIASAHEALDVLVGAARSGDFTGDPRDDQACKYCAFRAPCGAERERVFERKARDARVRARLALRES